MRNYATRPTPAFGVAALVRRFSLSKGFFFDKEPTAKQLYQIAELATPDDEPTRAPAFMRLIIDPDHPRMPGEALDFRDEIMAQIYDRADPAPETHAYLSHRGNR